MALAKRLRTQRDHRRSRGRMSDYLDGDLTPGERRRLDRHADGCPECRNALRSLVIVVSELRGLRRPARGEVASQVVGRLAPARRGARRPERQVNGRSRPRAGDMLTGFLAAPATARYNYRREVGRRPSRPEAELHPTRTDAVSRDHKRGEACSECQWRRSGPFEELVRRHADRLYAVVLRVRGSAPLRRGRGRLTRSAPTRA